MENIKYNRILLSISVLEIKQAGRCKDSLLRSHITRRAKTDS
jgi:hypothetical protein